MKDGSIILTHEQRAPSVAYLPTADLAPIKNPPRRGRLPNGVVTIRRPVTVPSTTALPVENPLEVMSRLLASMQASLDFAVDRLAEYEKAQRRTG